MLVPSTSPQVRNRGLKDPTVSNHAVAARAIHLCGSSTYSRSSMNSATSIDWLLTSAFA